MSRRGALLLALCAALLLGSWWAWKGWRAGQLLTSLQEVARSADIDKLLYDNTQNVADAVDLAIKGIHLVQGKNGEETWRLQANWATLRQQSGLIDVREPDVRYVLGRDENIAPAAPSAPADAPDAAQSPDVSGGLNREQYLFVTAEKGQVSDNNTRLDLDGNVISTRGDDVLTGPTVYYTEGDRTLVYPDGAVIKGPTLNGDAGVLKWNLDTNILSAENGINLEWKTPKRSLGQAAEDRSAS